MERQHKPQGVVFFLHGNGCSLENWLVNPEFYRRANYDLFMVDYRGYGKSTGQIESEAQLQPTGVRWGAGALAALLSDVLGGAYVFPGGKLDANDAVLDAAAHPDQDPAQLHAALGEPGIGVTTAAGLYVAALREAFEESRVLFTPDIATARAALLHDTAKPFNQLLAELQVRLETRHVLPWSRWITPRMASVTNKRFDTRFFVAAVPPEQEAAHDAHEATESVWLAPRTALQQYWDGLIELAPPQIMSLSHLSRLRTVASVMDAARKQQPPLVLPESFDEDGTRVLCYPGDPRHSVAQRALAGVTRLMFRNKRFEPVAGFEALFN